MKLGGVLAAVLLAALLFAGCGRRAEPTIVVFAEGDSLTYGQDTTSTATRAPINGSGFRRSSMPYPETLNRLLGARYEVVNLGFPGDRTIDGLRRWNAAPPARIAIIMYGTNDALNFGSRPSGVLTTERFEASLSALIQRRQRGGAQVIVVAAPALADDVTDRRVEPYRAASARVAVRASVRFVRLPRALGWTDGVHLTPAGYEAIAYALAPVVEEVERHAPTQADKRP